MKLIDPTERGEAYAYDKLSRQEKCGWLSFPGANEVPLILEKVWHMISACSRPSRRWDKDRVCDVS